jgi:hypothetical protein
MRNQVTPPLRTLHRDDSDILSEVRGRLLGEGLLGSCSILPDGDETGTRAGLLFPEGATGVIEVQVTGGVVHLRGEVGTAAERELAARLVHRVPGCRRVVNQLRTVSPPPVRG